MSGVTAGDVLKAILALLGLWLTYKASVRVAQIGSKSNKKATEESSALAWAQQMGDRLSAVEAEVAELKTKLVVADRVITALSGYVDALLWWIKTGQKSSMPRPPAIIRDHLDPNLVDVDPPVAHDGPPSA